MIAERGHQPDVLTDDSLEHLVQLADDGVHVQHLERQDLPPAEDEQLLGQGCRPLRCIEDGVDVRQSRVFLAELLPKKLAVGEDDRQHVVVIVGHSASERADGLHALGHLELLLQDATFHDVQPDPDDPGRLAAGAGQRPYVELVVGLSPAQLLLRRLALEGASQRRLGSFRLFRIGDEGADLLSEQIDVGEAVARELRSCDRGEPKMPIEGKDDGRNLVQKDPQAELTAFELCRSAAAPRLLVQRAKNDGGQPVEATLEDEIIGAGSQRLGHRLFANGIGHQDERQLGVRPPHQLEGPQAGDAVERVVGQHHVPAAPVEGQRQGLGGSHPLVLDGATRTAQDAHLLVGRTDRAIHDQSS